MSRLVSSTRKPLNFIQRWVSRFVWSAWIADFLFWEGTGDLPVRVWATLSETAWDLEENDTDIKRDLEVFLLALTVHIRYRTTLKSSIEWADAHLDDFGEFLESHQ